MSQRIVDWPPHVRLATGGFVCLILGHMPAGFERLGTYCLQYNTRTNAYSMLLTERYPRLGHAQGASEL